MTNEANDLMVVNNAAIMPVMNIEQAVARRQAIVDFTKAVMVKDTDYGRIPGTTKDTLLKPGAEKLTTLFGLSPRFGIVEKSLDWTGRDHNDEPFFYFQYRCSLWRGDLLVGEGIGSCNSWEKKYRWRNAELVCPHCGQNSVIKGKAEYGGGWLCWGKKGGCGAKWADGDKAIESQDRGQVANQNPADLVNTLDKMAQKRALVAATLIAVNASEFFTQDVEDMPSFVEGSFTVSNGTPPSVPEASTVPVVDQRLYDFAPDDEVIVHGDSGDKPGVFVRIDESGTLAIVEVDGRELKLKVDRLSFRDTELTDLEEVAIQKSPPKEQTVKEERPIPTKKPTAKQTKQLHAVGTETYGQDWEEKRHELVYSVTNERTKSSNHITAVECQTLIDGMLAKLEA